jgi:hypothetical protein
MRRELERDIVAIKANLEGSERISVGPPRPGRSVAR